MNGIVFVLILGGALTSAYVAATKNRNPAGWFLAGALLPVIALMVLAISPKLPPPDL